MQKMFGRIQNLLEVTNNETRVFTEEDIVDIDEPINRLNDSDDFRKMKSYSLDYLRNCIEMLDD